MQTTVQRAEKEWHESLFGGRVRNSLVVPERIRNRYLNPPRRPRFYLEKVYQLLGDTAGKRVLCFGCGDDTSTVLLALKKANVIAFDLSEEAVRVQRGMAEANEVTRNLRSLVCAAEEMPFRAGTFDMVLGIAILHHIPDHLAALPERLSRVLRKGGKAIFLEPVIRSSSFGNILKRLPGRQEISPGERQLTEEDLAEFQKYFTIKRNYFCLLSRVDRFLLKGPLETASFWRRIAVRGLHELDHTLLQCPGMDRFAAVAVLELERK
jgi:ubiquinone/menaquinone biosynthesis C-methylase UbiE